LIFVTVGNATQGFRRLLDEVERLATDGLFGPEPVLIQSGNAPDFKSRRAEVRPFLPMDEFMRRLKEADLIISHGGCGTLLSAVRLGKIPVVMPRRKKYGEHVNDHQVQLTEALAAEGLVVPAYEPEDLPGAIAEAKRKNGLGIRGLRGKGEQNRMRSLVAQAIEELMKKRGKG
jgi:UDP-N-acetylglucosamine transferase subunit ALG13